MNKDELFLLGDCRETLKGVDDGVVQCCITSPPYFGLRDYGNDSQIGLEETPEAFVAGLVDVFREVKRVLRDDGTLWLNLGDSYSGEKNLIGIPWKVAFALQADGWYLRQDIIWNKPNPMPESVTDRCTKAHEYIFLLSKSQKYFYEHEVIREPIKWDNAGEMSAPKCGPDRIHGTAIQNQKTYQEIKGANKRSVWTVTTKPYKEAHFATYPPALITPCVLAGSRPGDIVLDPFTGAGTTAMVAKENSRKFIGCELNQEYLEIAKNRIANATPGLGF